MVRGMRHEWADPLTGSDCYIDAPGPHPMRGIMDIEAPPGRMHIAIEALRLAERERKPREALADYLNEDECHCEETESGPCMWCAGSALLKEE